MRMHSPPFGVEVTCDLPQLVSRLQTHNVHYLKPQQLIWQTSYSFLVVQNK